MGKPATTYFCQKGHMVESNPPGIYGEMDILSQDEEYDVHFSDCDVAGDPAEWPLCRVCGSNVIKKPVLNWADNEFCKTAVVQIGFDVMYQIMPGYGCIDSTIGIYDVSSLA